jgi:hypothetical protein
LDHRGNKAREVNKACQGLLDLLDQLVLQGLGESLDKLDRGVNKVYRDLKDKQDLSVLQDLVGL